MASSSFSSYFPHLCLSMFLALSSVITAMPDDYNGFYYDEADYDYPQQSPAPESGDGSYYYDYYPQSPAPESGDGSYYYDGSDYDYYPQLPAPESGDGSYYDDGSDYDYYPQSPAPEYCREVVRLISTCQEYLNGHKDSPSSECCNNLDDVAFIGIDVGFKDMCDCMKDLQASFHQRRAEDEIFNKCRYKYAFLPISRRECSMY